MKTVNIPAKACPVVDEVDVLVVGGGAAGIGAAIGVMNGGHRGAGVRLDQFHLKNTTSSCKGRCETWLKRKRKKFREPFRIKKEIPLLPGYIMCIAWVVFTIMLVGWVMLASLSTSREILGGQLFEFASGFHWENYSNAWSSQKVGVFFVNSLICTAISCTVIIVVASPAAYVLSRFRFRGNMFLQNMFATALGIPVIRAQASKGIGKQELYSAIAARHGRSGSAEIVDYGELETDIREITRLLPRQGVKGYPSRWFAIKLLEQDSLAEGLLASVDTEDGRIAALTRQCRESWATRHGEDMVRSIAHARFAQARDIAARCSERLEFVTSVTEKVDAVLCHRFWGPAHPAGDTVRFLPGLRHAGAIIWPPRSGRSGASWRSGPPPSCRSRAFWKIPS